MKNQILLLLISLPLFSFAGKTYTVTVNVYQLDGRVPLKGVTVQFINKKKEIIELALTNESGKATFTECKENYFDIVCMPGDKNLEQRGSFGYYNSSNWDIEIPVYLQYSKEAEIAFISKKMTVPDLDTALFFGDSCQTNFKDAEFPGGRKGMLEFIQQNMKIPLVAEELGVSGKTYVEFIIDYNGDISYIHVNRGIPNCPECDAEAIRVMSYSPKWSPASCNGEAMVVKYTVPIIINVQ